MLWKKSWEPEAVLALIGGVMASLFLGAVTLGLLRHAEVAGFHTDLSLGTILVGTLSFQGTAILLGIWFLKDQQTSWAEVLGPTPWLRCLGLAAAALLIALPIMRGLQLASGLLLQKLGLPIEDELAVKMVAGSQAWVRAYLSFFAVVLAPMAEEFFFRGVLFSTAKRYGWTKTGWIGVSFLFALVHANLQAFLPLFLLALALTWLYEKTGGLLAPMLAHSLFNTANLILLCLQSP